jgi:predicted metal-binding protein
MHNEQERLEGLTTLARFLGATDAAIVPAHRLAVEDRFAEMCGAPTRCPSYGLAPGCPPHAIKPSVFRDQLAGYRHILVFKIDAPVADLMSEQRLTIARDIHRLAATLERAAASRGWALARGFAAGSCKELFCETEERCVVLAKRLPCRRPDAARPSLSAMGVDFTALAESVGWQFGRIDPPANPGQSTDSKPAMGLMAGLVLLA